jgi:hypothetical protein
MKTNNVKRESMWTYPIVVMKLVVKVSSEKRKSKQLFPTPASHSGQNITSKQNGENKGKLDDSMETRNKKLFSLPLGPELLDVKGEWE